MPIFQNISTMHSHTSPHRAPLWLISTVVSLALVSCGGGGDGGSYTGMKAMNATVAAQIQSLKPSNVEDTVGVFVELNTTQLSSAALNQGDPSALQTGLQKAFLAQLMNAAQSPVAAGAASMGCDVSQLTQRIQSAYLPTSGAAVRLELNACEFDLLPVMPLVIGVHPDIPLATQNTAATVSKIKNAVRYSFDGITAWPTFGDTSSDGKGVVVAILDSGVELKHPALQDKIVPGACFSTPTTGGQTFCPNGATFDTRSSNAGQSCIDSFGTANRGAAQAAGCGHGTGMAGIAAMNYTNASIGGSTGGMARSASILPIQVFTGGVSAGRASIYANSGDLLRAIEWLTTEAQRRNNNNLPRIAAVNMSLGGGRYTSACDTDYTGNLFKIAFANLRAQGVLAIVAAGNEGQDNAIAFPACIGNVVAVGATQLGNDKLASYSNLSPQIKIFAQGGDRGAAFSWPTTSANPNQLDAWASGSGTSPATALVSGAAAVLRQIKPNATLADIEKALQTSDKPSISDRSGTLRTIPQLRLTAAAKQLGLTQTTPAPARESETEPVTAPTPPTVQAPVHPPELSLIRVCFYSQINYQGQRACGIFAKGENSDFSGWWTVRSVRFFAYDMANPLDMSKDLVTDNPPKVMLYNSTLARRLGEAIGVRTGTSNPDLSRDMPNSLVRAIQFFWS